MRCNPFVSPDPINVANMLVLLRINSVCAVIDIVAVARQEFSPSVPCPCTKSSKSQLEVRDPIQSQSNTRVIHAGIASTYIYLHVVHKQLVYFQSVGTGCPFTNLLCDETPCWRRRSAERDLRELIQQRPGSQSEADSSVDIDIPDIWIDPPARLPGV